MAETFTGVAVDVYTPEAMLANEVEVPYAAVAMSTDYDCWKEDEAPVSWEEILTVFNKNADRVKALLVRVIPKVGNQRPPAEPGV